MAHALASNCTMDSMTDNKIKLLLAVSHQPMLNPKLKDRICEALSKHFGKEMQLEIEASTSELATPVKQQQASQAKRLETAKQSILQDPNVKQLIDMYDATVEV